MKNSMVMTIILTLGLLLVGCGEISEQTPNQENGDPGEVNQGPGDNDGDGDGVDEVEPPGELLQGVTTRNLAPDVSPESLVELAANNRNFSLSLLQNLVEIEGDEENLFLSPHSISLAMAMAYAGAQGETKAEIAAVLRFLQSDDEFHAAFNALGLKLDELSEVDVEEGDAFDLEIVNQTWGHVDFPFQDEYLNTLAEHYGAGLRIVDFESDFEEVRMGINKWVEYVTRDRIVDLLPQGVITALTRFVLVNAVYFYGSWENKFEDSLTEDQPFTRLDGSEVLVPLMRQTGQFGYLNDGTSIAISIPYVGGKAGLVAVMPAESSDDFLSWESALTSSGFDALVDGVRGHQLVNLSFPKFESEGSFSLKEVFNLMGIEQAFDPSRADFQGITGSGVELFISDVIHKTFVSIDEEGTEAAAATAVIFGTTDAEIPQPVDARFDRPFLYGVYDFESDTILFLGRMVDPS